MEAPAASPAASKPQGMRAAVIAARGAAAKSYASRINKLFGWSRSAADLLFDAHPAELVLTLDASHDHSTLSALAITKAVDVLSIYRPNARVQHLEVCPSLKVTMGDHMTLRGPVHVLATIATIKGGKPTLAPRPARDKLAPVIRTERQSLMKAAGTLYGSLLPLMMACAEDARIRKMERRAVTLIQATRRGQVLRRAAAGMLQMHRTRNRAAKLRSRRLLASMLRASHEAPVCTSSCFVAPTAEELAASAVRRQAWSHEHANLAIRFAKQASVVRAYCGTLNRYLAAAPEARKMKELPWSPLRLLTTKPLELTAKVDKRGNNTTVGALQLPQTLTVVRLCVNSRWIAAPKNATSLNTTKLLDGDQLTLRGQPRHLAAICDAKNGKLILCPAKERKEEVGAKLRREHDDLSSASESLARRLQRLVRARLALREEHRRSHAALVLQIAWAGYMADRLGEQLTARRELFELGQRAASTRRSAASTSFGQAREVHPPHGALESPVLADAVARGLVGSWAVGALSVRSQSEARSRPSARPLPSFRDEESKGTTERSPELAQPSFESARAASSLASPLPTGAEAEEEEVAAEEEKIEEEVAPDVADLLAEVFGRRPRPPPRGLPISPAKGGESPSKQLEHAAAREDDIVQIQ